MSQQLNDASQLRFPSNNRMERREKVGNVVPLDTH